eukprot:6458958-Amphidinium_carterae.1
MSVCPGHLGTAGRRVTSSRSDSARPEAPSADGGGGSSRSIALGEPRVIQAEMVRNAPSNDGWDWSNEQEVLDLDTLPLTSIPELTMHREPYVDETPNPLADIEAHPTFEGGRALNGTGIVCCRCTQRYVFSAMAWVRNEHHPYRGMVTTLCDWRNSDVDKILNLQKEKDVYMQKIQAEQLKKHWLGENRDLYRDDIFQKQAVGNRGTDIALMCFRCLGESENEPL